MERRKRVGAGGGMGGIVGVGAGIVGGEGFGGGRVHAGRELGFWGDGSVGVVETCMMYH